MDNAWLEADFRRDIWHLNVLHFANDIAHPDRLVEWVKERRDLDLGVAHADRAHLVRLRARGPAPSWGGTFDPVMPLPRGATLVQEAREMSILVGMPANTVPLRRLPNASRRFSRWQDSMLRLDRFSRRAIWVATRGSSEELTQMDAGHVEEGP